MKPCLLALSSLLNCFLAVALAGAGDESQLCDPEPTTQPINYGDVIECALETAGDTDIYRFNGRAGERIVIQIADSDSFGDTVAGIELFDPQGSFIASAQRITARLGVSGSFTILVSESEAGGQVPLEQYWLTLESLIPRSPAGVFLCFGCTERGSLDPLGDADVFYFDGTEEDVVHMSISDTDQFSETVATLQIFDPDGLPLTDLEGEMIPPRDGELMATLQKTGSFSVLVTERGLDNPVEQYSLTLQCTAGPCTDLATNCALQAEAAVADLAVSFGSVVKLGDLVNSPLVVLNRGDSTASDVRLEIRFPPETPLQQATSARGSCSVGDGQTTCLLGSLAPGERLDIAISLRLDPSFDGLLDLQSIVTTEDCDPDESNNSAQIKIELPPGEAALREFFFPQMANGAAPPVQFRASLILSSFESDGRVQIDFFRSPDGLPMELSLRDHGRNSSFEFNLSGGQSLFLETEGNDPLRAGYIRIRSEDDVTGALIFERTDLQTGVRLFETAVPATELVNSFSIFVDSVGDRDTGLAMVLPRNGDGTTSAGQAPAQIEVRLYDESFTLVGMDNLELAPGHHLARFAYQLFSDSTVRERAQEMRGTMTIYSDRPLAAATLRQTDAPGKDYPLEVPTLTTFPVIARQP